MSSRQARSVVLAMALLDRPEAGWKINCTTLFSMVKRIPDKIS